MIQNENSKISTNTGKITPFLWFNANLEEVMNFYTSIFKNSKILTTRRMGGANAKILTATFELEGAKFMAIDGGPHYALTPAFSLFVNCDTQEEADALWDKLCENGKPSQCGWLVDQYGLSWQVIPAGLNEMLCDPDPAKANRVLGAMMKMIKIDINVLKQVYNNE